MGLTLVTLIFFAFVALWIVLPFLPGLREIRERRDIEPLRVVRESEVNVVHFAQGLRRYLETQLDEPRAQAHRDGGRIEGALDDGTRFEVLGADVSGPTHMSPCESVVLACGDLALPDDAVFMLELYAEGRIGGGARGLYRAVLAEGDLDLGPSSQVLRWAHANGNVTAADQCELYGRLSAAGRIRLGDGCRFERLHAPLVEFGVPREFKAPRVARTHFKHTDVLGVTDVAAGRWRIKGDLAVPEGAVIESDLVIVGRAHLDAGAIVHGSIKAHGDVVLGAGVEVLGSIVSQRNVYLGEGCRVHGPVISERRISIGPAVRIGAPDVATTVSAAVLSVAAGAVIHGTAWAHQGGVARPGESMPRSRSTVGAA